MLLRILLFCNQSYAPEHCIYVVLTMGFPYSRWWDQPEAPRLVSEVQVAADPSSHPRHRTSGSSWLPKPSCFASSSKGNKISHDNSMEEGRHNQRVTRNSLVPNLRFSAKLMTHWMPMLGFVPSIQVCFVSSTKYWCKQGPLCRPTAAWSCTYMVG